MKVMIDCDKTSTMKSSSFDPLVVDMIERGYDVRVVCRGHMGRIGDEYDYIRANMKDPHAPLKCHFTEGLQPDFYLAKHESWVPDMVIYKPQDSEESWILNAKEDTLDEREPGEAVGGEIGSGAS